MKREITLAQALTVLLTNNVPGQNISYAISLNGTDGYMKFGKGYNPVYGETAWTIASMDMIVSFKKDNVDEFLTTLLGDDYIKICVERKMLRVWEEV